MFSVRLNLGSWKKGLPLTMAQWQLANWAEALTRTNMGYLGEHANVPPIYGSSVRYNHLSPEEEWADVAEVLRRGWGDCLDLSAWRAAELRIRERDPGARCIVVVIADPTIPPLGAGFHIRVRRGDNAIEDPAQLLGMRV